jgi:hypothetical protein
MGNRIQTSQGVPPRAGKRESRRETTRPPPTAPAPTRGAWAAWAAFARHPAGPRFTTPGTRGSQPLRLTAGLEAAGGMGTRGGSAGGVGR